MGELLLKDEVFQIIGCCIEVHTEMGWGFLEAVYQETLAIEFSERGVPFKAHEPLAIYYKGRLLEKTYCPDFICFGQIVVEIKAQDKLTSKDEAQLLNYLKATGYRVGLLINFGAAGKLEWKRMVR